MLQEANTGHVNQSINQVAFCSYEAWGSSTHTEQQPCIDTNALMHKALCSICLKLTSTGLARAADKQKQNGSLQTCQEVMLQRVMLCMSRIKSVCPCSAPTRADGPSWGRALASAGFVIYAGNHRGSLVQQAYHD